MTAGEYCNREVVIIEKSTSIAEAAQLMRSHHVGDLVVVDKQADKTLPIGIITDRDLVIEIIAQGIDPGSVSICDIMSTNLVTVRDTDTLLDTLTLMQQRSVRRVLVVDEQGGLQGILTADDALELISEAVNNLTKLVKRELISEKKQHP